MYKYKVIQTCLLQTRRSRLIGPQSFSSPTKSHAQNLELRLHFHTLNPLLVCITVYLYISIDLQYASSIYRQPEDLLQHKPT